MKCISIIITIIIIIIIIIIISSSYILSHSLLNGINFTAGRHIYFLGLLAIVQLYNYFQKIVVFEIL